MNKRYLKIAASCLIVIAASVASTVTSYHGFGPYEDYVVGRGTDSGANYIHLFADAGTTDAIDCGNSAGATGCTFNAGTVAAATLKQGGVNTAVVTQLVGKGTVTYTAGTSDSATVTWPDGGTRAPTACAFSPTNSTAAAATVVGYISAYGSNSVTITHVATSASGGTVAILCTAN